MMWAIWFLCLFSLAHGVLLGQIRDTIIVGNLTRSISNLTKGQCICKMIGSNGSIDAVNFIPSKQICQLFPSSINPIAIQQNFNATLIFPDRPMPRSCKFAIDRSY